MTAMEAICLASITLSTTITALALVYGPRLLEKTK